MADKEIRKIVLERLYIWELPVRLTHWLLFFMVFVLAGTGYYIGHPFIVSPGPADDHLIMATIRTIHLYAAIIFTAAVFVRIYWFFAGNSFARWPDFVPLNGRRLKSLWTTFRFYSFLGHDPDDYPGHNALAGASYAFIFLVYLVLIATGLALYTVDASENSPFQVFGFLVPFFGGLQYARLIHHVLMWIVLWFAVVHVYFVFLSSIIEHIGTFDSIFSGYKFVPRKEADSQ